MEFKVTNGNLESELQLTIANCLQCPPFQRVKALFLMNYQPAFAYPLEEIKSGFLASSDWVWTRFIYKMYGLGTAPSSRACYEPWVMLRTLGKEAVESDFRTDRIEVRIENQVHSSVFVWRSRSRHLVVVQSTERCSINHDTTANLQKRNENRVRYT